MLWVARRLLAIAASTTPSSLAKASGNSNAASLDLLQRFPGIVSAGPVVCVAAARWMRPSMESRTGDDAVVCVAAVRTRLMART